jgi:hypothetical protein
MGSAGGLAGDRGTQLISHILRGFAYDSLTKCLFARRIRSMVWLIYHSRIRHRLV